MPLDVEVVKGKKHRIQYTKVNPGEVFKLDGVYYLQIGEQWTRHSMPLKGSSPLSNTPTYHLAPTIQATTEVELVNATLTIND